LRPSAELVTGFASRYRRDSFYRTGWNILFLQIAFSAVVVGLAILSLTLLYDEVLRQLIGAIAQSLASGSSPSTDSAFIASGLEYEKQKSMVLTVTGILVAAAIFSWLITSIALRPTKNALQSQKQFVGNIAHELRTPLAIIKTDTEVALFNERLDKDTKETLASNLEELDRISDIINNLLSMNALLDPGKIAFENVDLGPIVERVERSLSELVEHKKITFKTKVSEYRTTWGNPAAVEQILMNITKNAVNYTRTSGEVSVEVSPDHEGRVKIAVKDTGIGIPEKDLDHVFEPFFRGDRSRNRASGGGSGLGLAIVGELVRTHKGKIRIDSKEGVGTTVSVFLPRGHGTPSKPKEAGPSIDFS
jgi:signal transduction histidine kinase